MITLAAVVFTPIDPDSNGIFGFVNITGFAERILNLFLLAPLAIFLKIFYTKSSLTKISIECMLTSVGIELIQLMIPGRVSDPVDVFTNGDGALCAGVARDRFFET